MTKHWVDQFWHTEEKKEKERKKKKKEKRQSESPTSLNDSGYRTLTEVKDEMKESDEFEENKAKEKSTDPGKSSFSLPTLFIRVLQRVTSQDSVQKIKAVYQRLYSYLYL